MDFDTSEIDAMDSNKLLTEFNNQLYDLLKQLNLIVKDEDIKYFYGAFKDVIKFNNKIIIDQYIINVLEYYDQIKAKDINFFINGNQVVNKYKDEESIISKIFKFKELFLKLSDPQKEYLFFSLNLLCYISARYFTLMNP
jgi:hypothetical protein